MPRITRPVSTHLGLSLLSITGKLLAPKRHAAALLAATAAWCALCLGTAAGQSVQYMQNKADLSLRSDLTVNPSTLALELQIPLGDYPGRAGAGLTAGLRYSSKVWRMEYAGHTDLNPHTQGWISPRYGGKAISGWTTTLTPPWLEDGSTTMTFVTGGDSPDCEPTYPCVTNESLYSIYRFFVHMPDGSTHEVRKSEHPVRVNPPTNPPANPTGLYYSVDGSQLRLEYNFGNGLPTVLYLPDGTHYVYESNSNLIRQIDSNGNTLTYNSATRQWTDTLGRTFGLPLPQWVPAAGDQTYTLPGFNGTPSTYTFRWRHLADARSNPSDPLRYEANWSQCNFSTSVPLSPSLFSGQTTCAESPTPFNPVVLSEIVLPTGQSYRFYYNVYGEIDKVAYPTGGYERYVYSQLAMVAYVNGAGYGQANRGVTDRYVSASGSGGDEVRWQYSAGFTGGTSPRTLPYVVNTYAPDGTRTERLLHAEQVHPRYRLDNVLTGMAYDERTYAPGGQMVRRKLNEWVGDYTTQTYPTISPRVARTVDVLLDTGGNALAATTTFQHDPDQNTIATTQHHFAEVDQWTAQNGGVASIPAGAVGRTSETTFLVNDPTIDAGTRAAFRSRNLITLPSSTRVRNPAGTIVSQSEVRYDEAGYAPLPCGAASGWADPGAAARGNATTTRSWLDTAGIWIETHAQYDGCGNLRNSWDARGNLAQISYLDSFSDGVARNTYAYPTQNTSPVPDPSNQRATNTPLVTSSSYDYSTGLVASTTDANGKVTSFQHNDPLLRPTRVDLPDGGWTVYWYDRNQYGDYVGSRTAINSTQNTESYQFFDGLGRPVRSFRYDGSQWITAGDTQYDALGRVWRVSAQPYLSGGSGSAINPSGFWTEYAYDPLGRVTHVKTTADNAQVVTSYAGNQATVTDQAGKSRRSVSDALGRLAWVVEDPHGLAYQTDYTYDALGNLRKVEQGGQQRFFMYDSLSRLVRARNPEQDVNASLGTSPDPVSGNSQWTFGYAYDANSNLHQRTDPRGVTTTYEYDNLNRVKRTDYSDGTPMTLFTYDFAANGRGRFYANYESSTSGAINYVFGYDAVGRPTSRRTDFHLNGPGWVGFYPAARTYDRMGNVTSQTYPSGRVVNYPEYDVAGRLKRMTGNLGDGVTRTYSTGISYDAGGQMQEEQFGSATPLYHKRHYNARGQLYDVRLSTVPWSADQWNWNRGALVTYFTQYHGWSPGTTGPDNNGNILLSQHWVPADDQLSSYGWMNQYYAYDALNRISHVREQQNGGAYTGEQHYAYDRWGNRTVNAAASYGAGIPEPQFETGQAASTNRLLATGDLARPESSRLMRYDAAGNLTNDTHTGAGARSYDAENRMTSAWGPASSGGTYLNRYVYDAAGKRMRRQIESGEVWHVYGFDGELMAEYAANGAPAQPRKEYGYRAGELLVVAEAGGAAASAQPITWQNAVGVSVSGGSLTKTAAEGWSNAGASSAQSITAGDGYFEFTASNVSARMAGLSNGDSHQSYTDIDFAIQPSASGMVEIWESGTFRWGGSVSYQAGDRFRVAVEGGAVKYYKISGGVTTHLYTSASAPAYPLVADTSLYYTGAQIGSAVITGGAITPTWRNVVGVSVSGGNLTKTDAQGWGNSGASSTQTITSGDGHVEFTAAETTTYRMAGLSRDDAHQSFTDIDFAIYPAAGGALYVYEGGAQIAQVGGYAAGDRLKVAVEGGAVKYYRNGALLYTSGVAPTYPLRVDTSFFSTGATIQNVAFAGAGQATGVRWLVSDHLGTPRMTADQTGSLAGITRHDYLPFGEEVDAGTGGRTAQQGYGAADGVRQKFTSKERDTETSLDYFLARYYSPTQGRFTSPDEFSGGPDDLYNFVDVAAANPTFYADLSKPQSLNKYQYAYNNPLRYVDPDGHEPGEPDPQGPVVVPIPRPPGPPPTMPNSRPVTPPSPVDIFNWFNQLLDDSVKDFRETWGRATRQTVGVDPDLTPDDVPAPPMPQTGTPPQPQAQPRTPAPTQMSPRPIDKPAKQGHKKGKNHNKHTGTRSGDKKPPGFKRRVPQRPQDLEPKPPKKSGRHKE